MVSSIKNKNKLRILQNTAIVIIFLETISYPASKPASDTLAIIGEEVITTAEYSILYKDKLLRLGITDNDETRIKYLQNLVDDELLISLAKQKGLQNTKAAAAEMKRISTQELLNLYSEKHISANIKIEEKELKELFIKMNKKIKVSHLYSSTKKGADSIYNMLSAGKSFVELAKEIFTDPVLKNNGGCLGYISIDEMDPDFEKTAYTLNIGETSKPVKTVQGYSIIKVDDIKDNPLVTENGYLKAKSKLSAFARKRAYEDAAKALTAERRIALKIKFNEPFINKLFENLNSENSFSIEKNTIKTKKENLKSTVVISTLGSWSLQTVINEMNTATETQKNWIRSQENLEDFIAGLIIRKSIISDAEKEKLNKTPEFEKKIKEAFDTYLLTEMEKVLKQDIKISPDTIKAYYENNKESYTVKYEVRLSSILLDKQSVSDTVKKLLESGKSFEDLARQYSIQQATAIYGGDMGFFSREDLGNIADQVFKLNTGSWTGPIPDDGKYVFLKCTEVKKPVQKTYADAYKEIEEQLILIEWNNLRRKKADEFKSITKCEVKAEKLNKLKL